MTTRDKLILFIFSIISFSFLIYQIRLVLMPFIVSLVISYFLHPLIEIFCKKFSLSRLLASSIVIFCFLALFITIICLIAPKIYSQITQFVINLPNYLNIFKDEIYPKYVTTLANIGIIIDGDLKYTLSAEQNIQLVDISKKVLYEIFGSTIALINILSLIFITPILIFYFLKDWNIIVNNFKSHLPKKFALLTEKILSDLDKSLSGFVRGQLLVCIVMAIFYSLILSIWGLNFGFAIGFITGILTFIPYIGAVTGFFMAIIVGLFQYNFIFSSIIPIIFIFALGQFIEANFLVPKLVGLRIGLHPVWIVFGLFVFGALFGLFGVFFATPLTAIFGVLIKHASLEYRKRFA